MRLEDTEQHFRLSCSLAFMFSYLLSLYFLWVEKCRLKPEDMIDTNSTSARN